MSYFLQKCTQRQFQRHVLWTVGNLVEIRCPDSVRRVASGAFEGCKSLERFILTQYSQLTVVEEGAFKGCCISNFTIPKYFSVEESDLTGILSLGENYSEKYCVQECFIMSRNKNILFRVVGEHDVISIPSAVRSHSISHLLSYAQQQGNCKFQ